MSGFPANVGTLTVYAGDTYSQAFTFTEEGEPVDLVAAGWTNWVAQFRPTVNASTSTAFTVDTSLASQGEIIITLTPTQTAGLGSNGVFDLQATQSGFVRTWLRGAIAWSKDVTRV